MDRDANLVVSNGAPLKWWASSICMYVHSVHIQAGRPKKSFLFGPFFFNITNVFSAKKWVGHACICPRMVTG